MQKSIFLFISCVSLLWLLTSCSQTDKQVPESALRPGTTISEGQMPVGEIINGKPRLDIDEAQFLDQWNRDLKLSGITSNLTKLELLEYQSQFYLMARGEQFQSSKLIETDLQGRAFVAGIMCTTSDYSSEMRCMPQNKLQCFPCQNKGKCVKTISL
ncbi:MAG: hypothetical protein AAFW00_11855 [Bacteroidota bacterium]